MKKILAVFLALLIIVHSVPFASAGGTAYTVPRTPIIEKDERTGSLNGTQNFPDEKEGKFFSYADVILSDTCFV